MLIAKTDYLTLLQLAKIGFFIGIFRASIDYYLNAPKELILSIKKFQLPLFFININK